MIGGVSVIAPLRPVASVLSEWDQVGVPAPARRYGYPVEAWYHRLNRLSVLSSVEGAIERVGHSVGPEYHISVSSRGLLAGRLERALSYEAKWVLAQFGLDGAREDNHVPHGVVRNFWRPVAESFVGRECPCVATEVEIRENKGDFIWRPVP